MISLGAGVQSSTLLLMAASGQFDQIPKLAIFADTGHEPESVYDYLAWLDDQVPSEIAVVQEADLLAEATGRAFNPIPLYLKNADGTASAGRRQCTKEFKLYPIRHELRRRKLDSVEMWVGISLDEVQRMKPSGLKWVENRWPLVEKRMTRQDCKSWLRERGYPEPPKSACVFCPYKSERDFARMRSEDPESFAAAVQADEAMRQSPKGDQFVMSSLKPVSEASSLEDEGQTVFDFNAECEGMCGV